MSEMQPSVTGTREQRVAGDAAPLGEPYDTEPEYAGEQQAHRDLVGTPASHEHWNAPGTVPYEPGTAVPYREGHHGDGAVAEREERVEREPAVAARRTPVTTTDPGGRVVQLVWLALVVAEAIVGLRVLFHAIAANRSAGFVSFIDTISGPLVAPFHTIVGDARVGHNGLLEIGSIIGMAIFAVCAVIVVRLIRIIATPRDRAVA